MTYLPVCSFPWPAPQALWRLASAAAHAEIAAAVAHRRLTSTCTAWASCALPRSGSGRQCLPGMQPQPFTAAPAGGTSPLCCAMSLAHLGVPTLTSFGQCYMLHACWLSSILTSCRNCLQSPAQIATVWACMGKLHPKTFKCFPGRTVFVRTGQNMSSPSGSQGSLSQQTWTAHSIPNGWLHTAFPGSKCVAHPELHACSSPSPPAPGTSWLQRCQCGPDDVNTDLLLILPRGLKAAICMPEHQCVRVNCMNMAFCRQDAGQRELL